MSRDIAVIDVTADTVKGYAWRPVQSSNIARIALRDDALIVDFKNGRLYAYDVGQEGYDMLVAADERPDQSVGEVFAKFIRGRATTSMLRVVDSAAEVERDPAVVVTAAADALRALNDAMARMMAAAAEATQRLAVLAEAFDEDEDERAP